MNFPHLLPRMCVPLAALVLSTAPVQAAELLFELDFKDGLKSGEPLVLPVEERGQGGGGPTAAPQGEGEAWVLDGQSALEVVLPEEELMRFRGTDPFILEAWVRVDRANASGPLISKGSGANYRLHLNADQLLSFSYYAAGSWRVVSAEADPLPLREWCHVVAQHDGLEPSVRLIINGRLAAAERLESPISSSAGASLFLGGAPGGDRVRGIAGALSGIRIYSGLKYPQASDATVGDTLFDPTEAN